jgi:phage shock protein A
MNIFTRIFKIGQSEAHSLVDKLEDPIKLTEQGIRDLKVSLDESLKAFAEVKALAIRAKKDMQSAKDRAMEYESKAVQLLQRAQQGQIAPAEADRLATEVLARKEENLKQAAIEENNAKNLDNRCAQLDTSIKKLRSNISQYENELKTLRARAKVSEATKNVNKQMAQIDSGSTISMLERMKEKVEKEEALAEAYGDIANESKSVDDEIDKVLGDNSKGTSDALAALKAKLGQLPPPQ